MSRWAKLRHLVCSPFGKHHTNADSEGAQNELSKPPPSSKPKHAEATTLRLLVRKGSIVKGTHVPYLNQFLGMLYKVRWVYLATALAAIFILVAFVFGAIFKGLDCIDESYVKISVLTLLQLFGGNGMDSFVSDDLSCLGVACVVSALTIIIQALIVSVVTARFMNPTVKVRIADHLVCKSRNDKRVLQFRVSSRNGHPITDVSPNDLHMLSCSNTRRSSRWSASGFVRRRPKRASRLLNLFRCCLGGSGQPSSRPPVTATTLTRPVRFMEWTTFGPVRDRFWFWLAAQTPSSEPSLIRFICLPFARLSMTRPLWTAWKCR
eukprot:c12700_g1_i1.p1 GENE.c12700_g1_i1~~c12700_g1_i1.p1  ORF type:complete len:329 (-),score=28.22 c12700_g1_i1:192-1154(-)